MAARAWLGGSVRPRNYCVLSHKIDETLPQFAGRWLCGSVRSRNYCVLSHKIDETLPQFAGREAQGKHSTRISGAPPKGHQQVTLPYTKTMYLPPSYDLSVTSISETIYTSESCSQLRAAGFSPKPQPDIFVRYRDKDEHTYFTAHSVEEDGTISSSPKYYIYPPSPVKEDWCYYGANCNGLFHYKHKSSESDENLLWNPTTNEFKILPNFQDFVQLPPRTYDYMHSAIWCDHGCEDYKLLQVVLDDTDYEERDFTYESYHIELYSLKTNSWKKIACTEFGYCGLSIACINGSVYCPAVLKSESGLVILSFDFSSETLSSLPLPPNLHETDYFHFMEYKGLFSLLVFPAQKIPSKYDLWVMKNGSWTRESTFHTHGVQEPLWFSKNGGLLYLASLHDELLVFDRATAKLKHLGIYLYSNLLQVSPFSESFVRLNDVEEQGEEQEREEDEPKIILADGPLMHA